MSSSSSSLEERMSLVVGGGGEVEVAGDEQPASPIAQYFRSSVLDLSILAVFESEIPVDDDRPFMWGLENLFLPINPRFSSIMVKDEHGIAKWKWVSVNLENHIKIPQFPDELTSYDKCLQDYLSKIALEHFPQDQPLWDMHLIKYPTSNAAGTIVFKLHHSLGDGFSLMGALFNYLRRADNPALPLTFPSQKKPKQDWKQKVFSGTLNAFSMCINTVYDFAWDLMSSLIEDSRSPIRSGDIGIELRPITLSSITFSFSDIKLIKTKVKGTVNDVVTGIIFYGIQLYMQQAAASRNSKPGKTTALVLLNTRAVKTYQSIEEMTRPGSKSPWGNHFTFLHVPIPWCGFPDKANPLDFVHRAKKIIHTKRNSLALYLTAWLLELTRKFKGPEAASRHLHASLHKTSMAITNVVGPMEQVEMVGHPISSLSFMVAGNPQSLTATVVSYMGKITVGLGAEKDFMNSKLLVSCMEKSFERMLEAAIGKRT